MNSARNANRHGNTSHRGRGRGGQQRGGMNTSNRDPQTSHSVPGIHQVIRGAPVFIVLKADQPTGQETVGIVAEILTRGNHPRGIKVRLQDGKVGRVQRMATIEAAMSASGDMSEMGRTGNMANWTNQHSPFVEPYDPGPSLQSYRNGRPENLTETSGAGSNLSDYVVVKTKGKKGKKAGEESEDQDYRDPVPGVAHTSDSATSICPVCKVFEGDEIAVAHHVDSHFE